MPRSGGTKPGHLFVLRLIPSEWKSWSRALKRKRLIFRPSDLMFATAIRIIPVRHVALREFSAGNPNVRLGSVEGSSSKSTSVHIWFSAAPNTIIIGGDHKSEVAVEQLLYHAARPHNDKCLVHRDYRGAWTGPEMRRTERSEDGAR